MSTALLRGVEGIFIPVKDPAASAKWYEEKLGFRLLFEEPEATVMKISETAPTVVCLVCTPDHQPMRFPDNDFGVGKYYNFLAENIEKLHLELIGRGVAVNPIGGEGNTRFFTFFDPDGNPLGVCQ